MSKLPLSHNIKNLKIKERNNEWLSASGVSLSMKFTYYAEIAKSITFDRKKIKYLGDYFFYDNPATPLNLQNYPYEISKKILANIDKRPKTILDIGGNIGQFSVTIDHILEHKARIDTFEPNPYAFEYLKKNVQNKGGINLFHYGLGENKETAILYFEPTRSGIGSFIKDNAGTNLQQRKVKITNNVKKLTQRKHYNLVKIDVEGYEKHVLSALKNITFDYMFIELSGQMRTKDYSHSSLFAQIQEEFGVFDIVYSNGVRNKEATFDVLLKFLEPRKSK